MRGIKGVCYIASHEMEPLWREDGIKYHTLKISPACEPHLTLSSQIGPAVAFLRAHQPALICSSCPKLRSCLSAAFLHLDHPDEMSVSACVEKLEERGVLTEPFSAMEREALDTVQAATDAKKSLGTPRGPRSAAGGPISPCGKRAVESVESEPASKRAGPFELERPTRRLSEETV